MSSQIWFYTAIIDQVLKKIFHLILYFTFENNGAKKQKYYTRKESSECFKRAQA